MKRSSTYGYVGPIVTHVMDKISPNLQAKYINEYCSKNSIDCKDIYYSKDESLTDRVSVTNILKLINEGDTLIVYTIHSIAYNTADLTEILSIIRNRKGKLHCILEEIPESREFPNTMLQMMFMTISFMATRYWKEDHFDYDKTTFKSISPSSFQQAEAAKNDGFLYIVMRGDIQIGSGKTPIDIYNLLKNGRGPKTSIHLYPCEDHEAKKRHLIAWLIYKQYVDHEDRDDTLIETANLQDVLSKMKEFSNKDPIITTLGDILKASEGK